MENQESRYPEIASSLPTDDLRREFLACGLFQDGQAVFRHWSVDRTVLGGIVPGAAGISLPNPPELRAGFFHERRESGIVNLGGSGSVTVDGTAHRMESHDALYIGRGSREVSFASDRAAEPARFWLLSYPAHASHPSRHVSFKAAPAASLGTVENANLRTLHKLIHPGAFPTCQVVMGVTLMAPGGVWNSMPPHTHLRRSEVYLYFGVKAGQAVFHFMGRPQATRHLMVHDLEAVLSPPWSIHCGVGTGPYGFVWGMGGENQEFSDMDPLRPDELR
jgi:4-deoxy-L-threo-5-hexosulose-uronate ketol-isomerase